MLRRQFHLEPVYCTFSVFESDLGVGLIDLIVAADNGAALFEGIFVLDDVAWVPVPGVELEELVLEGLGLHHD